MNGPAAARLYDEHVDAIYGYAARRVGPDAAVTVVEDVFEQALRQEAKRPATASSDLGWLLAIATAFLRRHSETERTRLLDWAAQPDRATPLSVNDPLLSGEGASVRATLTAEVMAAVAELEPAERDLLFLVAWEGCSSSLTASATGIPQSEIRGRLSTVRKELRNRVSRSSDDTDPNERPAAEPASTAAATSASSSAATSASSDDIAADVDERATGASNGSDTETAESS